MRLVRSWQNINALRVWELKAPSEAVISIFSHGYFSSQVMLRYWYLCVRLWHSLVPCLILFSVLAHRQFVCWHVGISLFCCWLLKWCLPIQKLRTREPLWWVVCASMYGESFRWIYSRCQNFWTCRFKLSVKFMMNLLKMAFGLLSFLCIWFILT